MGREGTSEEKPFRTPKKLFGVFCPAFYLRILKTKTMIAPISVRRLHNAEFVNFFAEVKTHLSNALKNVTVPAPLDKSIGTLNSFYKELDAAHRLDQASQLNNLITDKDAERDSLVLGLTATCEAGKRHPNAEKRAAFGVLRRNLQVYGSAKDITQQSLAGETADIANLLNDWRTKPELLSAWQLTGLGEWLDALETANNDFRAAYAQRTTETATTTLGYTMEGKRIEASRHYNSLMDLIASYYRTTEGAEPWLGLVAVLNAHIETYSNLLAQRAGRLTAAKATEEPNA